MTTPIFSILHATYGRPEKAVAAMRMWFERAERPEAVEYIFAVNQEDDATLDAIRYLRENTASPQFKFVIGDFAGSAPAWDAAAKVSTGDVLIQASDDVEPPQRFDGLIKAKLAAFDWRRRPIFIATSDGFRKDSLCASAVMNRPYYKLAGHFIPPEYRSVHSDGEVTYRAIRNGRSGAAVFLSAKDIILFHRHHYHDKAVPWDATYARGNVPEVYDAGGRLLAERNPDIVRDGIADWL